MVVFYVSTIPLLQVMAFISLSLVQLSYTISVKPFHDKHVYYQEVFNEASILAIGHLLLAFTDIVNDAQFKYNCGWAFIAIFITNVSANIVLIVLKQAITIYRHLKRLVAIASLKLRNKKLARV